MALRDPEARGSLDSAPASGCVTVAQSRVPPGFTLLICKCNSAYLGRSFRKLDECAGAHSRHAPGPLGPALRGACLHRLVPSSAAPTDPQSAGPSQGLPHSRCEGQGQRTQEAPRRKVSVLGREPGKLGQGLHPGVGLGDTR